MSGGRCRQRQKAPAAAAPAATGPQAPKEGRETRRPAVWKRAAAVGPRSLGSPAPPRPPPLTMQPGKLPSLLAGSCSSRGLAFPTASKPSQLPAPPSCLLSCPSAQWRVRLDLTAAVRPIGGRHAICSERE